MGWFIPAVIAASAAYSAYEKNRIANRQADEARRLSKIKQPESKTPDAALEALNRARISAIAPYTNRYATQQIGANTANQVRNINEMAGSSVDALNVGAAAFGQGQNTLLNQGISSTEDWRNQQDKLSSMLMSVAGYQDVNFQRNKLNPYLGAKAAESALWAARDVNKMAATDTLTSGLMAGASAYEGGGGSGGGKSNTTNEGTGFGINNPKYGGKPYAFGGVNTTSPETINGLSSQDKMQLFYRKHGRYPYSWEISSMNNKNPLYLSSQ